MRLSRIELVGFKSFCQRTEIVLPRNFVAVVGPNGAGKSNVVDAIRWALGEQSAKSLRGRQMGDVIFAGSERRPPMGYAEVSLYFERDDTEPPPAPYLDFPEIKVTRVLHRDGTSEYRLQDTPCRLKDIYDAFAGTGIGPRAYAIIEQGKVSEIVGSRPEDRRRLIEEAAGVSRYRAKKKDTENMLAEAEANLLRIEDIVRQLEERRGALQEAVEIAERYEALVRERDDLLVWKVTHVWLERMARLGLIRSKKNELRSRKEEVRRRLEDAGARLAGIRARKNVLLEEIRQLDEELFEQENALRILEGERNEKRARLQRLREARKSAEGRIQEMEETLRSLEEKEGELAEQKAHIAAVLEAKEDEFSDVHQQWLTLKADLKQTKAELAAVQKELHSLQKSRMEKENEWRLAQQRKEDLRARLRSLVAPETTEEQIRQEVAAIEERLQDTTSLQELEERIRAAEEEIRALKSKRIELERELRIVDRELERSEVRLRQLHTAAVTHEGLQKTPSLVLSSLEKAGISHLGVVADHVDPDDEITAAILREKMEYPILAERSALEEAIRALDDLEWFVLVVPPRDGATGREVVEHLRDGYGEAEDMEAALASPPSVTPDGLVVDGHAIVSRGIAAGKSVLEHNREIEVLGERVQRLGDEQQKLHQAIEEMNRLIEERVAQVEELRQRHEELALDRKDLERTRKGLQERLASVTREWERFRKERDSIQRELERLESVEFPAMGEEEMALKEREEELASRLEELEERAQELQEERTEGEVSIERWKAKLEALDSELTRVKREREARMARKEELLALLGSKEVEVRLEEEIRDLESRMLEQGQRITHLREHRQELQGKLDTLNPEEELTALKEEQYRKELENLKEQESSLAVEEAKYESLLENLDPEPRPDRYHTHPPFSYREEQRLKRVERQIHELAPRYNPTAKEEFQEVSERHAFLLRQKRDVEDAIRQLRQAIEHITATSRQRFLETFESVKTKFSRLFPLLFGGGEAELILEEGDPLEAGIEIRATPPGKRPRSMELLSGGEKALTSIALVFSIFLHRPSPFCVLDEVDAPLDEHNVDKFVGLISELARKTQFVVITHNRRTMEAADMLYGVTMEEPGCSKVVRLELQNLELDLA